MSDGRFDLKQLAKALNPALDDLSKYLGVVTNRNRYALRKQNGEPIETPQFTHMRIAMGLSYNEKDPTKAALEFYRHMSNLDYVPGGSTRVNAGGSFRNFRIVFSLKCKMIWNQSPRACEIPCGLQESTGGIGIGFTKLRAAGSGQNDEHRVDGSDSIHEND